MLTAAEKQACRNVKRTDWRNLSYGTKEDGFCPIGAVAILRGIHFYWWEDDQQYKSIPQTSVVSHPQFRGPITREEIANLERFNAVKEEVLAWAGYPHAEGRFVQALAEHGTAIFPADEA